MVESSFRYIARLVFGHGGSEKEHAGS
jgi:hypothetical protein